MPNKTGKQIQDALPGFLKAGGDMGRRMAAMDWASSPLGPVDAWPGALKSAVAMMLPAPNQIVMFWGLDLIAFYNDAYAPTIGDKHPQALGRPARENWAELWDDLEPMLRQVLERGDPIFAKDRPFYIERHGEAAGAGEQVFFDISYSPVPLEDGTIGGVLCLVNETTQRVAAEKQVRADNARLAAMFEQTPSYIAVLAGPDHVVQLVNQAYDRLIGHRDILGRPISEGLPEIASQGFVDLLDSAYRSGDPFTGRAMPVMLQREADGPMEQRLLDFVYQPVLDADGRVQGIFVEGTDVTEAAEAERARAEAEDRLRLATEAAQIGTWDYDPRADTLRWDARCKALFGLPPHAEVDYRRSFLAGLHAADRDRVHAAVMDSISGRTDGYQVEYRTVGLEDGIERWCAATGRAIFADGQAVRFVGTITDITPRKRAQEQLEILNRTAAQVAAELDLDRLVQGVVDAGVELTGAQFGAFFYNRVDEAGESYMLYAISGVDRLHFENFPMPRKTAVFAPTFDGTGIVRSDDITADPRYGRNDTYHGMPAGHLPVRSYLAAPVMSRSGEVIGGLFFGHEEIARFDARQESLLVGLAAQAAVGIDNARLFEAARRANDQLAQKVEERTQERDRIWDVNRDLLGVTDAHGILLNVNPAWTHVLGWRPEQLLGTSAVNLAHPDDLAEARLYFRDFMNGDAPARSIEIRMRSQAGNYHCLSVQVTVVDTQLYIAARDISEERARQQALEAAEDALRQSQKMETLGQLTGGVAHDFNNLLQIVTGNLETLQRNLADDQPRLRRAADNAMTGAARAATLTQRLLAFARRQPLAPKAIEPNRLVAGMSDLFQRTLGETVEIETVLAAGLWRVEADPNQLETAILNLAINGRDAMPDGGKLTIETFNAHLDRHYAEDNMGVPAGQYVAISVSDTGGGMDPDTLGRAFEPFFTTKDVGRGTGLGLSMVYGFVKQSGGNVKIYSEPGEGTSVKIYLPRLVGEGQVEEDRKAPIVPEGVSGETILLCEDDADVRAYSVEVLTELGYSVLPAEDGPSALRLLEGHAGQIALLFTDVVLPGGMTGAQLAVKVQERRPGIKVLFTTGYARNAIVHHGRLDPGVELITKPFGFADLAARVRDLLDG